MEKIVQKFRSFEKAERAEDDYYASLTPQQRLDILFSLIGPVYESEHAPPEGSLRVPRVSKRKRR